MRLCVKENFLCIRFFFIFDDSETTPYPFSQDAEAATLIGPRCCQPKCASKRRVKKSSQRFVKLIYPLAHQSTKVAVIAPILLSSQICGGLIADSALRQHNELTMSCTGIKN